MKKLIKFLLKFFLIAVSLLGIILILVFMGTLGVKKAADQVLTDFKNGQFEKVYNESLLVDEFSLEEIQQAFGLGTDLDITRAEKLSWVGRGFEDNKKYISGNFRFPNGEEILITFKFIKKDGKLVLSGIVGENS